MEGASVGIRGDLAVELVYAARYHRTRYAACLLLGTWGVERGVQSLDVRGYAELGVHESPYAFLRELLLNWSRWTSRAERRYGGVPVVGWAGLRPGAAGEMSTEERVVHRTCFSLPHQVFLSVDADTERVAVWGASRDGSMIRPGFSLVGARPPSSAGDEGTWAARGGQG